MLQKFIIRHVRWARKNLKSQYKLQWSNEPKFNRFAEYLFQFYVFRFKLDQVQIYKKNNNHSYWLIHWNLEFNFLCEMLVKCDEQLEVFSTPRPFDFIVTSDRATIRYFNKILSYLCLLWFSKKTSKPSGKRKVVPNFCFLS